MNPMEFCKRHIRTIFCVFVALINCGAGIVSLTKDDTIYGILLIASAIVALLLAVSEFYRKE